LEKLWAQDEPPMPIDPDLVGWWTLDEGVGSTVNDFTGKGHVGKITGDVKWCEGNVVGAIRANGGFSGIEIADAEDLRINGDLTMALWIRKDAEVLDWVCVMGRGMKEQRNYGLWMQATTHRYMYQQYAYQQYAPTIDVYGKKLSEVGKWTHVAVTSEQDLVKLYFDGELDGQAKRASKPWSGAAPLGLGYAMYHTGFKGALDDVRVYRRALMVDEVRALYGLGR